MLAVSDNGKTRAQESGLVPAQNIACGNTHTLCLEQALSQDAAVIGTKIFGFGGHRNGQLGLPQGAESERHVQPTDDVFCRQNPRGDRDPGTFLDLVEVACGSNHSAVLERVKPGDGGSLRDGHLWTFGLNASGQLGRGHAETHEGTGDSLPPGEVIIPNVLSNRVVVQRVCCGSDHTLAIANFVGQSGAVATILGRVFAWGLSGFGALGTKPRTDPTVPHEVWFPTDIYDEDDPLRCERSAVIRQVAAGNKHSVALGADGSVYTWGHGGNGRLGLGYSIVQKSNSYTAAFEPKYVAALRETKIKYIAVGEAHSGAVDQLGGLHTWGQGSHGRCGHGVTLDVNVPTRVESLTGVAIKQIAFGLMHSIATTMKGQLYAWGKGPATGLDSDNNAAVPTPRLVEMPDRDPVYQIAAGPLHTVLLMCDGTLYCFGSASEGRLPFKLPGGPRDQTFPRKMDRKGWSLDHEKAVSHGNKVKGKPAEEDKAQDRDWWPGQICSGGAHSAALCEGGQTNLWFWGARTLAGATEAPAGQGDAEREDTWQPALLKRGFLCTVKMVAIGLEHCLAITVDGQMYSWGMGERGQLGSGNLRGCVQPQPIGHPTDVIYISAGEEHSACIIEGGEAYLWGNAEGGRLGLGNCLSEGIQLLPKQVVISNAHSSSDAQAVLLRSVACGSQHTAFISEDDRLLTFGMGWFGRLGHGNLENQYSPCFVRSVNFQIKSVHCALFHTCIVDQSNVLWVCGRDSSICREGKGHQTEPMQFEPFLQEPRRYIHSIATSEEHTLAITFQKNSQLAPELWVWGKNNRGQLGLPSATAPRIDMPWQLNIPDLEGRKASTRYDFRMVSTAPGHSLLLVILSRYSARLQAHVQEPLVYTWGYSGNGRLGLIKDADERLMRQHDHFVENSLVSGSSHTPVYPPVRVEPRWRPEETLRRHTQGADPDSQSAAHLLQASQTWYDVQLKLYREPQDQKPRNLEEMAGEVSELYEGFMRDVLGLWDKPVPGSDIAEYNLRQKQREIEAEYVRSLKVLNLGMSMCAPKLKGRVKTNQDVLQKLPSFEQLVWVLQQQPLYMANLASCLWGKKADDPEAALFHRVTEQLYLDLKDQRTLHLFKALLRVMIEHDAARATALEELFDASRSRVVTLFTQLSTNIHMIERIAMPVVDPERESSLVSIIIRYTVSPDDVTPRSKLGKSTAPDFSGVFVTKWQEYEELLLQYRTGGGEKVRPEQGRRSRQHFTTELRLFKELCIREEGENEDGDEHGNPNKGRIQDFLSRFVRDILKKEDDLRMLLVCAFTHLTQRGYVITQRADDADSYRPGVCAPITSLVLAGLLGGVLNAVNNDGQFSLVRLKIRQQVRRREAELIKNWNADFGKKDDGAEMEVEPDTEGLIHRVFFNIQALANFFRRVVAPRGSIEFGKDAEKEEPMARDCALLMHAHMNETLLSVLQQKSVGGSKGPISLSREYGDDTTETELTADLYTAHYSLRKSVVSLSTADLLELTNLLWKHMKMRSADEKDGSDICIDDPERDAVCQLVKAILPTQKQKGSMPDAVNIPWSSEGQLALARDHGEYHNLTLPSRFLEFERSEEAEPTFCDGSQAPIPKFMSKEAQKGARAVRAVKPLRSPEEDKGPDGAFEFLEELLQDLSGNSKQHSSVRYQIEGQHFSELQTEFVEFQRQISQDVEEGRVPPAMSALLQRLEDGKRMIDKIREQQDEKSLRGYIDKQVRRRSEYYQRLIRLKNGADDITKARDKYKADLKSQYAYLTYVYKFTVACDIPDDILAMAQRYSERLAFEKGRVKKSKLRRNHPTPAQRVLESLKNDTKDGKITDELRDKVGFPARSFKLRELVKKGVIVCMNEHVPDPVQQQMDFTFQFKDEGWVVQAYMKTTLFKEFLISRQDIQLLQAGRKPAEWSYGDDFLRVNCFRLMRLLAWIYAEGAL